jgi:hypothetical protein
MSEGAAETAPILNTYHYYMSTAFPLSFQVKCHLLDLPVNLSVFKIPHIAER